MEYSCTGLATVTHFILLIRKLLQERWTVLEDLPPVVQMKLSINKKTKISAAYFESRAIVSRQIYFSYSC